MQLTLTAALLALGVVFAAQAADPTPAQQAQRARMAQCNADAKDKVGDERKAFMKDCLAAKKMTPQDKMKACNADAKGLVGDERKAFMKKCLSAT